MAETDFTYDIFISYSHKDEEWVVNTLLPALENAGLKVCIDFRDFDAGRPSIVNMEDAVDESRHTVLVLTPNWTSSEWTDFESILTQTDDPAGRRQKLIPIMLEKCAPPKRVRSLTYIDFMRSDRLNNAWSQLFKALGKPNAPIPTATTSKPDTGSRETWHLAHPYPMPPNFTGRAIELKMLDDWLADDKDRLFILRALGGFGKSALAWQWINTHVDPAEWTKLVWWSFYEGDASFEHFIEETLKYLKLEVPQGQRPQVDALLKAMQSQKILLIMDGFERALRAYSSMNAAYQGDEETLTSPSPQPPSSPAGEEGGAAPRAAGVGEVGSDCVNINAEFFLKGVCSLPNIQSKVLMTMRLTPRVIKPRGELLQGCREDELTAMQKADAVEFFHKQKIKGTHAEIEAACAPYGYHPLSLRLLAGRILKDFENPADIVVAQKIKIDGDLKQQKHHVLEVSYNSVPPHAQKFLSTIACFRSHVEHKTLESIAENKDTLDNDLHDLIERGLLHFDEKNRKFDLHPIVRRYAYERLTSPDRTAAHTRLRDYFASVDVPAKPQTLDDLAPVIELYHHTVQADELDKAFELFRDRLANPLYFQMAAYQTIIDLLRTLFLDGENNPPPLKDKIAQGWTLSLLGSNLQRSGQSYHAVKAFEISIDIVDKANHKENLAIGLGNIAKTQRVIGAFRAAESNLRRRIDLSREIKNEHNETIGHTDLGLTLCYLAMWREASQELDTAYKQAERQNHVQMQGVICTYRAQRFLLMARSNLQSSIEKLKSSIDCALRALELANEDARTDSPVPRDYIRAYWLLGAAFRANDDLNKAEENLFKAISMCRQINLVEVEADILLDLARLRYDQKKYEEAKNLADEALSITERCGYVLQGADVNLFLAQYALEQENDKKKAMEYAETALKLAMCDGPPYYYKVAYEEAERMLEKLK